MRSTCYSQPIRSELDGLTRISQVVLTRDLAALAEAAPVIAEPAGDSARTGRDSSP